MDALIVFAHPESRSFNGALRDEAVRALVAAGHRVEVSDLYADYFEPRATRSDFKVQANGDFFKYQQEQLSASRGGDYSADIAREQERVRNADLIIFQFPLYWFSVPAVLKGWIDRTLANGFAYGVGRWFENAPLFGKKALLSLTTGASADQWGPNKVYGDLEAALHPLRVGTLNFCGFELLAHHVVHAPARMSDDQRSEALTGWRSRLSGIDTERPLPFRRTTDFDG